MSITDKIRSKVYGWDPQPSKQVRLGPPGHPGRGLHGRVARRGLHPEAGSAMSATDPTGALAGEFHPGHTPRDLLPQRIPGVTLGVDAVAEAEVQRAARRIESEGTR